VRGGSSVVHNGSLSITPQTGTSSTSIHVSNVLVFEHCLMTALKQTFGSSTVTPVIVKLVIFMNPGSGKDSPPLMMHQSIVPPVNNGAAIETVKSATSPSQSVPLRRLGGAMVTLTVVAGIGQQMRRLVSAVV
jgi:hypothetical protein